MKLNDLNLFHQKLGALLEKPETSLTVWNNAVKDLVGQFIRDWQTDPKKGKPYRCVVCRLRVVDAINGFDTCVVCSNPPPERKIRGSYKD